MSETNWPNLKAIREELRMSQSELAALLGISPRTIQSCEQGWRRLGCSIEKNLLLVLLVHRHGEHLVEKHCWDVMQCSQQQRDSCLTYRSRQGCLCWFLTGNKCTGKLMNNWDDKKVLCRKCKFFRELLPDCSDDTQSSETRLPLPSANAPAFP